MAEKDVGCGKGGARQAQRTARGRGVEFKGGRCVVGDSLGPEPALRWPDEGGWDLIVTDGVLGSCPDPRAPGGVRYREWESSGGAGAEQLQALASPSHPPGVC